jgi:hypothetical protein
MSKLDLETLKWVKQCFDFHSDHSTQCNGYRTLCDQIKELETPKTSNQCCDNPEIIKDYEPRPAGLGGEQLLGNYRIMFRCKNCNKLSLF